jgi:hypothetical protein
MADEPWVGLAEAVSGIRSELQRAMREGEGEELRFAVGPVEVELTMTVQRDVEGRAKVMVLPWGAEAKGGLNSKDTSRLKLTLRPVDDAGGDARISDRAGRRPE